MLKKEFKYDLLGHGFIGVLVSAEDTVLFKGQNEEDWLPSSLTWPGAGGSSSHRLLE